MIVKMKPNTKFCLICRNNEIPLFTGTVNDLYCNDCVYRNSNLRLEEDDEFDPRYEQEIALPKEFEEKIQNVILKCECGGEVTSGKDTNLHAHWCPKSKLEAKSTDWHFKGGCI